MSVMTIKYSLILPLLVTALMTSFSVEAQSSGATVAATPEVIQPTPSVDAPSLPPLTDNQPLPPEIATLLGLVKQGALPSHYLATLKPQDISSLIPKLQQLLNDDRQSLEQRWLSAMAMARLGGATAQAQLLQDLDHRVFLVRMAAIKGLEVMMLSNGLHEESQRRLQQALHDSAMVVRTAAADSLGVVGSRESLPALITELSHERNFYRGKSLPVRKHLIMAIAKLGGQESLTTLIRCLRENDTEIVESALVALSPLEATASGMTKSADSNGRSAWLAWWEKQQSTPAFGPPPP